MGDSFKATKPGIPRLPKFPQSPRQHPSFSRPHPFKKSSSHKYERESWHSRHYSPHTNGSTRTYHYNSGNSSHAPAYTKHGLPYRSSASTGSLVNNELQANVSLSLPDKPDISQRPKTKLENESAEARAAILGSKNVTAAVDVVTDPMNEKWRKTHFEMCEQLVTKNQDRLRQEARAILQTAVDDIMKTNPSSKSAIDVPESKAELVQRLRAVWKKSLGYAESKDRFVRHLKDDRVKRSFDRMIDDYVETQLASLKAKRDKPPPAPPAASLPPISNCGIAAQSKDIKHLQTVKVEPKPTADGGSVSSALANSIGSATNHPTLNITNLVCQDKLREPSTAKIGQDADSMQNRPEDGSIQSVSVPAATSPESTTVLNKIDESNAGIRHIQSEAGVKPEIDRAFNENSLKSGLQGSPAGMKNTFQNDASLLALEDHTTTFVSPTEQSLRKDAAPLSPRQNVEDPDVKPGSESHITLLGEAMSLHTDYKTQPPAEDATILVEHQNEQEDFFMKAAEHNIFPESANEQPSSRSNLTTIVPDTSEVPVQETARESLVHSTRNMRERLESIHTTNGFGLIVKAFTTETYEDPGKPVKEDSVVQPSSAKSGSPYGTLPKETSKASSQSPRKLRSADHMRGEQSQAISDLSDVQAGNREKSEKGGQWQKSHTAELQHKQLAPEALGTASALEKASMNKETQSRSPVEGQRQIKDATETPLIPRTRLKEQREAANESSVGRRTSVRVKDRVETRAQELSPDAGELEPKVHSSCSKKRLQSQERDTSSDGGKSKLKRVSSDAPSSDSKAKKAKQVPQARKAVVFHVGDQAVAAKDLVGFPLRISIMTDLGFRQWYYGCIVGYNVVTSQHCIAYEGYEDTEWLDLAQEMYMLYPKMDRKDGSA